MPILNYETKGSKIATLKHDTRNRSTEDLIVNEDWSIVVEVVELGDGFVIGKKVWDESASPKLFHAILKYDGFWDTPGTKDIDIGQIVVFHRVGEFEGQGTTGIELHKEDSQNKSSWLCLINKNFIWVEDNGDGTGKEVRLFNTTWITFGDSLPLITIDQISRFYDQKPPWNKGRKYLGQRSGNLFLVQLLGFGPLAKTFTQTAGGFTFILKTDSSGKVIDFSTTSE